MRPTIAALLVVSVVSCAHAAEIPATPPCERAPVPVASSAALAVAADGGVDAPPAPAFDPAPWIEDLHALIAALSSHYANLDYAVGVRHLNLAWVAKRCETRLRAAKSEAQAKRAFRQFLNAFGDAHLDIDWTPATGGAQTPPGVPPGPLCARLGYEARDPGGVDFTRVPGFTPIDDGDSEDFPGGVLRLPSGVTVGILRIGLFMESVHPKLCEAARAALGLADDVACDDDCHDRVDLEVADRLTAALERRATSLARAGVAAIVIDITGNGGGTNWVQAAVRVLTPMRIGARPMGAVRGEHWAKQLRDKADALQSDLAAHGDIEQGAIATAIARLRDEIASVSTPCDKSGLWQEGAPTPACSQLVTIAPVIPYAKPEAFAGRDAEDLFGPSRFRYHEGTNKLPLAVVVDGDTGSAAEDFVEMLEDHHAAIVLGVPTVGAGCGFTNGGIPTELPQSHARVHMSDCARFRADGSNAVAGVTPDVALPLLNRDSPYQRAVKVAAGLDAARRVIVAQRPRPRIAP